MQSTEKMKDVKEQAIADDIVALLQGEDITVKLESEEERGTSQGLLSTFNSGLYTNVCEPDEPHDQQILKCYELLPKNASQNANIRQK